MARAAAALEKLGYDLIDLNFACPVYKILRRKRGGFLMQDPEALIEIFREVREAVSCPVLMKLRSGFDTTAESREKFWQICEDAVDCGVDGLIIHGRTVDQLYRGQPDWDILAEVKQRLPHVPLIGSGNLFKAETVLERLQTKSVDGVAIARGAVGNPWIFTEIRALLEGREKPPDPDLAEQAAVIRHHLDMVQDLYGEGKAITYFRKFAARYARRHPERKTALLSFLACKNRADVEAVITQFY
jgi:nifR3 family TIM-barrel protein